MTQRAGCVGTGSARPIESVAMRVGVAGVPNPWHPARAMLTANEFCMWIDAHGRFSKNTITLEA